MHEGTEMQRDHIITNLERLNNQVSQQMAVGYVFRNGIIHGLGFVIGSTVLTALVVSIVLQFFDNSIFADVIRWIVHTLR